MFTKSLATTMEYGGARQALTRPTLVYVLIFCVRVGKDPLGLSVGEFYSRLVKNMLDAGTLGDGAPGPIPVFSVLKTWIDKIESPALACMTAQSVAVGMTRYDGKCCLLETGLRRQRLAFLRCFVF